MGRLIQEDEGIEGCGYFHRKREMDVFQELHVLGNIVRILVTLVISPLYLLTPRVVVAAVVNYIRSSWLLEFATTPDAVLSN
ncbi:hypothetical protein DFH07DRAFT_744573, partial [Mycena maculata]